MGERVKAALAAMRRASTHHLLSSAEQAKLLAVAEAAQRASEAKRAYRVANDKYRSARWGRLTADKSVVAEAKAAHEAARKEGREARKALKAALAALVEP